MSTPASGLAAAEAARRLAESGPNELRRTDGPSPIRMFARQFASPLVILLVGAASASAALGEIVDAVAIAVIVLLNAVVGFVQEFRAETALRALRSMTAPRARVRRDGNARVIPAAEVVPGDLLLLEAGDLVAADARIIEAHELSTIEATLTGESLPVRKGTDPTPAGTPLAERKDQLFLGTSVATGTGVAEVLQTGMNTEMG